MKNHLLALVQSLAGFMTLTFALPVTPADRQLALDPVSWVSFEQREAMGRERAQTEGGTAAMAAGVYYQPERSLRRYASVSEFALPEAEASGVRSATLQLVQSKSRCKGDGPLALHLRAFSGDGTATPEDGRAGAVIHTLQGACDDAQAFSRPIDVTAAVKARLSAGDKHVGFSLEPANDRVGIATVYFHKPDRMLPEDRRHRLIVTLSGEGGDAAPAGLDVFGVKLGMTPDEARHALRARSKDLQIKEQRETVERLRGEAVFSMLNAELTERIPAGPLERFSVHFALPPAKPGAIYVARFGVFKPGQEPSLADVKTSLVKKYGEPSAVEERASDWTMVWAHAPDGARMVDKTVLQRCRRHGAVATNVLLADPDSRYLSKGCGVALWAHMDRNQIPRAGATGFGDLASTLTLSLVDDTRFKDMRLAMKSHAAQTERQAARPFDLDKAPEVTPRPALAAPSAPAHTPWLEEMPSVERVRAEIRGKDEQDTAARQAGAFYQLREMLGLLAGDRRFRNQLSEEERRLMRIYAEADGAARAPIMERFDDAETRKLGMNSLRAKFVGAYTGYQFDKGLTDELLKRFFSPDFGRIYRQAKAESDARTAAATPTEQTLCFPSPCPPNMKPKQAALPPEPEEPAKPDPAIAKAKAAGVDTKVFGVPLGEPLRLPSCTGLKEFTRSKEGANPLMSGLRGISTSTTCQSQGSMMGLIGGLAGVTGMLSDRYILLAENTCPPWAYCEVVAFRHEGNLAGVTIMVQPGAKEDQVGKHLRAKYGKPSRSETAQYQNEFGARYEVDELEWNLTGLHVQYTPGPRGGGQVLVETETGRKAREARDAAREAKQPKL